MTDGPLLGRSGAERRRDRWWRPRRASSRVCAVLLAVVLPFAGVGSVLPYAIYILAALTSITVVQRIAYVRTQLNAKSEG